MTLSTIFLLFILIKYGLKKSPREYLGLHKPDHFGPQLIDTLVMTMGVMVVTTFLLKLWNQSVPSAPDTQKEFFSQFDAFHPLSIMTFDILGPIQEELLYRGFLLKAIEKNPYGKWGAIIMSAFLFGIAHACWGGYNIILITFINGLFWGWLRHQQRSIALPILMHMMANFIANYT